MTESKERKAYRMKCKHYAEISGHCYKQSGELGRKLVMVDGQFRWVSIGFIDVLCTADCDCPRMRRYDKKIKNEHTEN
jgi:hypothetical protein|nr:MAG TPA: hypothetical protein [Caudoviricetes sp.]